MRIAAQVDLALAANALERDALEAAMPQLTALFEPPCGTNAALLVASTDAGSRTALRFWAEAQRTGVAFANPELFPWCLANAPGGALARRFDVRGPNATWLGGREGLDAAWAAAASHLENGTVSRAFVVAIDFGLAPGSEPRLRAWRLEREDG